MKYAILILSLFAINFHINAQEVVKIGADLWPPYNADPKSDSPGWGIEMAKAIFDKAGIKIDYQIVPWTRALESCGNGELDAVIGAIKDDFPVGVFPAEPVGYSHNNFYVLSDSTWSYKGLASLDEIILGVIQDYSYNPDIDDRIEKKMKVEIAKGDTPLELLIGMLERKRIGAIIEDEAVFKYTINKLGKKEESFKTIVFDKPEPIYLAFSPKDPDKAKKYADIWDKGVAELRSSGELKKILDKYKATDWKK